MTPRGWSVPMDPRERLREAFDRTLITAPLQERMHEAGSSEAGSSEAGTGGGGAGGAGDAGDSLDTRSPAPALVRVIIDLHYDYRGGHDAAGTRVRELVTQAVADVGTTPEQGVDDDRTVPGGAYVVARLEPDVIRRVAGLDRTSEAGGPRAIYRIWPDFRVHAHTNRSFQTVNVRATRATFDAWGEGIVWAVLDSGIDGRHRHFAAYDNLALDAPLEHKDFTGHDSPLTDEFGHGTHVAGIIAGGSTGTTRKPLRAARRVRDEAGDADYVPTPLTEITGMAPRCRLVSYKVLDENGDGDASTLIAALQEVDRVNNHGRDLKIHGVNLSLGYPFDPEWFACGHSPLCKEVDRLVDSGVVVVVSAGNTGFGSNLTQDGEAGWGSGQSLTVNDPGNAAGAITVGATHRDSPETYGVSFFSSKGPTGDGRVKPDLVAPGERILGPAAGRLLAGATGTWDYLEDSGTSMAAPHVSGAIAALLSARDEYIGEPARIKQILTCSATDLGRARDFQGHGLLDLFRAMQSLSVRSEGDR